MIERHPYGDYIPKNARYMLIGSFPIGKFTNPDKKHEIKDHEIDFFFGGEKNLLWKLLGLCFDVELKTKSDIVKFLRSKNLAIGDVIQACRRRNGSASDAALCDIEWNLNLLKRIKRHHIKKVFFTSKSVELWFDRMFPEAEGFERITLISPSAQSVRSLPRNPEFQKWVKSHPGEPKFNFILADYQSKFRTIA